MQSGTERARAGYIWVCGCCGKTSPTKFGFDNAGNQLVYGWDVSCSMNAQLCRKEQLVYKDGRVSEIKP